jgi:superfamily II DNA or RNA helicase
MSSAPSLSNPGTLVHARGREWVVLPDSTPQLLMVRPVGGLDEEVTGILPAVEPVSSASFSFPTPADLGDFASGRLLRDAARLSTRAAAGPFRCFGRIAVEPRPYQLVPLMMALKQDPVRLLIADDVGIGKTIEAALIARELLDRGEISSFAILCPPQLAEQWQRELSEKFHLDAELVLSSTVERLERNLNVGVSVFDRHRITIVSTDFIKSDRRASDFALKCPELVIVDEAHGCTLAGGAGRGRQQRYDLIRKIASNPARHVILVTATPHSGNEQAFRSLLGLLNPELDDLPADIDQSERKDIRKKLALHLVQRRRADIRHYLEADTAFPQRQDKEVTYGFTPAYRKLFDDILAFAREYVTSPDSDRRQRRVLYWSALALLRCVSSSPAAAAATLRSRAAVDDADEPEQDEVGRRSVLDQDDTADHVPTDVNPGSDSKGFAAGVRSRLLAFARQSDALPAAEDAKLQGLVKEIKALLRDGFHPIVFCRFIETAEYVARNLREALSAKVQVECVTGLLPPAEREARIDALGREAAAKSIVLVCTDCLSEGVNLQAHFNAVIHYDLSWNPTRHEQREGRVDRFGQKKVAIRVLTYYGKDNPIDGVILDVLIRKHKRIKSDLGVAVSIPGASEQIIHALFQGALFRQQSSAGADQMLLPLEFGEKETIRQFHAEWDSARDREKASRSLFAQLGIAPESVAAELQRVREAIGRADDVARFLRNTLHTLAIRFQDEDKSVRVHISNQTPRGLRQAIGRDELFQGRFELPLGDDEIYLGRTSPVIEGLAGWVLDQALDPAARDGAPVAARCGVTATSSVPTRTTLLLVRFRMHLRKDAGETLLCEEILPLACTGNARSPTWLGPDESAALLDATVAGNLTPTLVEQQLSLLLSSLPDLQAALADQAVLRATAQLDAHQRVREAAKGRGRITVAPVLPVDILGAFTLLPRH